MLNSPPVDGRNKPAPFTEEQEQDSFMAVYNTQKAGG